MTRCLYTHVERNNNSLIIYSAVNLKGIWPMRALKVRAVHAAGGLGHFLLFVCGNLAEAAVSAASMQFAALNYKICFGNE